LVAALSRSRGIIIGCTLAAAAAMLFASLAQDPVYEATATLRVDPADGAEVPSPAEVVAFAEADEVARRTAQQVGGPSVQFIFDRISISEGPGSTLEVTASSGSPEGAVRYADIYGEEFVDYTDDLGDAFAGQAQLVQRADLPADPVSPRTVRDTMLAAGAGLLLGLLIALLRAALDRRVRGARELPEAFGVPLLARIPDSPALELDEGLRQLPAADAESFQMARVGMRYLDLEHEIKSVLLTSPEAGDGKTTVTFGLAAAAATTGERVLVIEADMRQPGLGAVAGPTRTGLSNVLSGKASLGEALMSVDVAMGAEGVTGSVDVLLAGPAPANPTQLLESRRMEALLDDAERQYDLLLIDTPPARILPDAIPLVAHVDGVIVVVGLDQDRHEELDDLRARLEGVNAPLIGVIANFAESFDESYYQYMRAHEAALAEAGTVPLQPAGRARAAPEEPSAEEPSAKPGPAESQQAEPGPIAPAPAAPSIPEAPADLNDLTLEQLRGFDLTTTQARRLIAYRERRGGFSSVDDIDEVPGFPDAVRKGLKRRVKV
jgi:capsular exopolysaccharide synthesis family protein